MAFEIKSSEDVSIPEVKQILEKRLNEGEVSDVVIRTYEYVRKFAKCSEEGVDRLKKFLKEKGFNDKTIAMILSICPTTVEELRTLLVFEDKSYDTSVLEEVVSEVKKYLISEK